MSENKIEQASKMTRAFSWGCRGVWAQYSGPAATFRGTLGQLLNPAEPRLPRL